MQFRHLVQLSGEDWGPQRFCPPLGESNRQRQQCGPGEKAGSWKIHRSSFCNRYRKALIFRKFRGGMRFSYIFNRTHGNAAI